MRSFAILFVVVVANCAAVPVDKVQQVGVQPAYVDGNVQYPVGSGQIGGVHGQQHVGQGVIHKPNQQYVPVHPGQGNVHYPVHGVQGQVPVQAGQGNVHYPVHGIQGQVPVHGVQGQIPVHGVQGQIPVHGIQGQIPVQGQVPVQGGQGHIEHGQVVPIGIISQDSEVNPDGTFHNVWEGENGIKVQEEGTVRQTGEDTFSQTVTGQISYIDNDGKQILLKYVADETGFHPEGDHLPTPPPLPLGIARGLEYIRAHPPVEETKLDKKTLLTEGRTGKQYSPEEGSEGY